jgi:hypothetical protein
MSQTSTLAEGQLTRSPQDVLGSQSSNPTTCRPGSSSCGLSVQPLPRPRLRRSPTLRTSLSTSSPQRRRALENSEPCDQAESRWHNRRRLFAFATAPRWPAYHLARPVRGQQRVRP